MTEQNHHDPAELDKLTEKFTVLPNENPASDAKRAELIDKPAFGQVFSDNMAHMTWTKGEGWGDRRIEPYAPLKMDPGASVLHYAQECFEGLKAYRHADGSTWLFRPDANAERFQNSAKRLYLPELPIDDFIGSVAALVKRFCGVRVSVGLERDAPRTVHDLVLNVDGGVGARCQGECIARTRVDLDRKSVV